MKIKQKSDRQIGWHIFLIIIVYLMLIPIVFALSNSFKTTQDAYNTVFEIIPRNPTLENYIHVFQKLPFAKITLNTFLIAATVTIFKTLTSIFAAYSLVYFDYKGKAFLYFMMLSTMFIPFTVTMIPNYLLISQIGLRDNIWGVALPQLADVLGIFLLRQSMRGIPKSLIEVAKLDKIGHMKIMRDIILPLVRPSVISTGIIFFINSWNEYVWPVLILKTKENYTLSLALQMYISSEGGTDFTIAMAVSVMTMIIPLTLYIIFQRYIINTFAMSGIKG
ncbi:MAG: carbohydrate ABC transporter permease [Eubacteriales bacterium]|nr:carbohydrate ABC transporter permease [Eubacteriales bacterium]